MTEYYMEVLVGVAAGYCLAVIALVMMFAKEQDDDEREADEENRN